ncbi:MAG: DsbA family protein [Chloroflexi bacterium]|nr:DsbA family protein [Chloroflexota bacterium]MCL5108702.1 DsbA family protein [Chloroflexota bacterium]
MSTARQIDKDYVATGKVRVVIKNRAGLGAESQPAAEAALCAGDQGKYWEFSDKLSEALMAGNRAGFNKDSYKALAGELGLNAAAFGQCVDGGKYARQVKAETDESTRLGITSTPTFLVNGTKIIGAQPYQTFQVAIEAELGK